MGSNKSKYPLLWSAKKMLTTTGGHAINKHKRYHFSTAADIRHLRDNPNTDSDIKLILSEPFCEFTKVRDHLFLTGVGGIVKENIGKYNIKCIINVTFEAPKYSIRGIFSIRVPVEEIDPNISIYFNEVSALVVDYIKSNQSVVVHSATGTGRASTIMLAILMKSFRMYLIDAYNYLIDKREIRPSVQNWDQLIYYEHTLFGRNTVEMVEVFDEYGRIIRLPEVYLPIE